MVVRSLPSADTSVPSPENPSKRLKIQLEKGSSPKDNVSGQRRASARLQAAKQKADMELLVKRGVDLLDENGASCRKKDIKILENPNINLNGIKQLPQISSYQTEPKVNTENLNLNQNGTQQLPRSEPRMTDKVAKMVQLAAKIAEGLEPTCAINATNVVEKSAHIKVKETLRLFNKHYLHFVQEEEMRCAAVKVNKKPQKGKNAKKGDAPEVDVKGKSKRPDLKAISKMIGNNEVLYPEKRIGCLPGIDVGHRFYSRAEMVAVGFHSHWLNGIDYMGQSYRKGEYEHYTFPLAVAIVLSGMYEDDLDNAEDVIYTGQGGHDLTGNKRQIRDQVLERGNLALKNSVDLGVPVRVIRGHESGSSYSGKVYTFDGLYKVVQYWAEKGISGFTVFKYRLRRLEGQSILTTNQVQFTFGRVPKSSSEIRGLVCEDISGGQEDVPIPATNLVDDPPVAPTGYTYSKSMKVARNIKLPANATGCNCEGACWDPKTCECARLNGFDFPYVHRDGGRLIEAKHVVFECGPSCGCSPNCINRTSQRGLRFRLEVFRTPKKGWAVRSWDFIPAGSPVCEYIGELKRTEELDSVSENNYIFEIDCLQTMRGLDGRERRQQDGSLPVIQNVDKIDEPRSENVPDFCIDAGSIGNIARFINHSCEPNLFIQCVLSSHHDLKLARVMLFAADNIPPLQELTYDYGYALDSVYGPDGKVKRMACYCGAEGCRKRLF
ncbi:histone-lysine N-methyltransferase, H3 lysine-9 specific SUVH4-like [Hibiscus syriacus]|uniref:histone-lysine N-methyltransferase, H3 lysine-9 specific SUVH4-like n=1 Tax=Hibiscus syriacus TaxID=106335 RepID=UPI0019247301|nr:histone-lysine N-methyltransferase, H3 lysine-9 specific SUVH4-like [Hibiscus syriacus]